MKTKDIVRSHNHPETDENFTAIYEAMQSDHRKEMSKISHEIRNPVTLINSYLQLISTEHPEIKDVKAEAWRYESHGICTLH